jgi:hypothetical protein
MSQFYRTKLLLEVEVEHQFDPEQAVDIVAGRLVCPAIKSAKVLKTESNFCANSLPFDNFYPFFRVSNNVIIN